LSTISKVQIDTYYERLFPEDADLEKTLKRIEADTLGTNPDPAKTAAFKKMAQQKEDVQKYNAKLIEVLTYVRR